MARFFSRNRSILKYLATLNKEKSFTERLTASNEVVQREEDNEEKKRDLGLFTKEEDIKIEDSATVTTLLSNVAASGITSKDAIVNLPSSGLTAGDASIVFIDSNTAKYYISNGEGWYNATFANVDPQWDSAPNSSYTLDSTNPLTIEPIAIDSGGKIFSYTTTLDSDANQFLTVTKDSADGRIFTLVGESAGAADLTNSGIVTFRASDGISFVTQNSTINLIYQSTGTLVSSAASVNEGSSVTFTLPVEGYSDGDTFAYSITGIQAADISQGLTGVLTVSGNSATVDITATADLTTEGAQTMTFTAEGQSVDVTINDTSIPPAVTVQNRGHYTKYNQNGADSVSWNINTGTLISATGNDCIIVAVGVYCNDDDFTLRFNSGISGLSTSRFGGGRYDAGNSRSRVYLMHAFTRTTGVKTITVDISEEGIDHAHIGVYRIGASNGISSTVQRKIAQDLSIGSISHSFSHSADDFVIGAAISNNPWGSWGGTLGSGFAPYTSSSTFASSTTNPYNQGYRYNRSFHYSDINSDITTSSSSNGTVTNSNALEMIAAVFTHN